MKAFINGKMTWRKVLLFAAATALLTAALKLIPALRNTSFQDIAINPECWIAFAMLIIVRCHSAWDAARKTFVFFLVSQPLIYLFQVPFSPDGFGIFRYYPYWFFITLLTFPGAAFAYLVRRRDRLALLPLAIINGVLGALGAHYVWQVYGDFPHHLLSAVFCFALMIYFALRFSDRARRIVLLLYGAAVIAVCVVLFKPVMTGHITLPTKSAWAYLLDGDDAVTVEDRGGGNYDLHAKKSGTAHLIFTDAVGEKYEFYVTVSGGGIYVSELND